MRKRFSELIAELAAEDPSIIFMTGDLGYNALEDLRRSMGDRFINTGVAEQNMVGMAAGMTLQGYKVFCYSIAPFVVYRCLEQTRNDVCLHNRPVFLVGNGGGYGYGIMGSSHHAIEDIATLSPLQHMNCHVPAFIGDLEVSLRAIVKESSPAYLRLGLGKPSPSVEKPVAGVNRILKSDAPAVTIACMGPVVNNVFEALKLAPVSCDLFTVNRYPVSTISEEMRQSLLRTRRILFVEEHVATGGLAQQLLFALGMNGELPAHAVSLHAKGYPGEVYGDQAFHQQQSGLDAASIAGHLNALAG